MSLSALLNDGKEEAWKEDLVEVKNKTREEAQPTTAAKPLAHAYFKSVTFGDHPLSLIS